MELQWTSVIKNDDVTINGQENTTGKKRAGKKNVLHLLENLVDGRDWGTTEKDLEIQGDT